MCLFTAAGANEDSWLEKDRINLNLGGFVVSFDSAARVSPSDGVGTRVEFEEDLGMDDREFVLRIDGSFRLNERSTVHAGYIDLARDGNKRIDREIIVDDTTYTRGTRLDSSFDYRALKLAYTHSFWQTSGYDIGFSAGLLMFEVDLNVESEAGQREGDGETSPFPMIGLRANWHLRQKLYLRSHAEFFKIEEGDVDGQLENYLLALEYRFDERLGGGIGYNYVELDIEDTESNDEFNHQYDGLMLYLTLVY